MRQLDSAHAAFQKNEERLQKLSMLPSEFALRQVRVTPYPSEDVGWIISQSGEETCLFSSDYPHVEGSHPFTREHLRHTFAGVDPDEIQLVVGHGGPLARGRLGRPDVHAAVDLHRVGADALATGSLAVRAGKLSGQGDGKRVLAARGGAQDQDDGVVVAHG